MDEVVGGIAGAVTEVVIGGVGEAILPTQGNNQQSTSLLPLFVVAILLCCIAIPFSIMFHFDYATQPRFTRLTFHDTSQGLEAELLVERQVAELHNIINIPDKISGPTPALKIQEHESDSQSPPHRIVTYKIVESLVRSRSITPEEPHTDSGIRNLIRTIPDDRVNEYLNAAAIELDSHGHHELAQVTRSGKTEIVSTEHNLFGTKYALWTWFFAITALLLVPFMIREARKS